MRSRVDLENIENTTLAPYAVRSGASHKRVYDEPEHGYRTAFQRDRDRIVHTSAFRRLEYKTQVFVNHEGDYYRTRLTHTMEVAQIAKTMARALGLNEDLTEAICLAHDLGHTPFGHSGQDAMAELMKNHGGFEHNRQSFRIVTRLETPSPSYPGLNLTLEVLEGIAKHATEYEMPDGTPFQKRGYPSIEAQLCNVADEIAYNNHDIDDGLKSGLIEIGDLRDVELWEERFQKVRHEFPTATLKQQIRLTVKRLIDFLVTDLITNTTATIEERGITSADAMREHGKNLVGFSDDVRPLNAELKRFLFTRLYRHWRVERMAVKAGRILTDLFKAFLAEPGTVPTNFIKNYPAHETRERIVCDYIAGMTDRFAMDEHARLFDPRTRV